MHKLWLLTFALGLFAAIMLGLPPAVTALGRDYDADVHIFEHMGPEELARLRDTSPQVARHVDAYLQHLHQSFEHMGAEELARLRDTSPQMAKHVDAYVQHLDQSFEHMGPEELMRMRDTSPQMAKHVDAYLQHLHQSFEHMGPEELARLRDTSPQMAKHVDAYVQDLVRSNRLRRGETNSSQQEIETMINRVTPSRLLEDWSHGSLTKR